MAKRLTDILKTFPKKSTRSFESLGGLQPHQRETATKAFLRTHPIQDVGEPYENDFLGGVKQFDRAANRYGHGNVDYNDVNDKGGLKVSTVPVAEEELDEDERESRWKRYQGYKAAVKKANQERNARISKKKEAAYQHKEEEELLGEVFDAYFEENPDATFDQAYSDIMEELERLDEAYPRGPEKRARDKARKEQNKKAGWKSHVIMGKDK